MTLTRAYLISIHEVSETIWSAVMGGEPSTSLLPKTNVTWGDAAEFCTSVPRARPGDKGRFSDPLRM